MKKLFFVFAALLLSTGIYAQSMEWGVKAGLNLASITKVEEFKMRPGLHAGIYREFGINDIFGIQVEALYSMMGATGIEEGVNYTVQMDYIASPIMAKIYLKDNFSLDFGIQSGYLVSAKVKAKSDGISAAQSFYDDSEKFDFSIGVGFSVKLDYGFRISARYNLGLTEIEADTDSKNNVIQLGLSYKF